MLTSGEIEFIKEIHGADFPLPDLKNPTYAVQVPLYEEGELRGAALLKVTSEAILILNPNLSDLQKARLIFSAFDSLIEGLKSLGLDDAHLFTNNEHFGEILKKHFSFREIPEKGYYWNG